jgi:hypothetical protein
MVRSPLQEWRGAVLGTELHLAVGQVWDGIVGDKPVTIVGIYPIDDPRFPWPMVEIDGWGETGAPAFIVGRLVR